MASEYRKFMCHGWLPILELDGLMYDEVLRAYTWGLDPSGTLDGLAGVGGLLAVKAPGAAPSGGNLNALYMHDAGGNVGQLVAWTTGFNGVSGNEWDACRLVARYEYDPYGRIVTQGGFYAAANPFRWSTKRFDPETGLSDFGMRYYGATLGRWINRDPIGDFGGANVYAYVGNNPTNRTDYLGLASASCRPGEPCHSGPSSAGGGDPWSPEPTTVEEGDRRPCPHAGRGGLGDDGRIINMIMPITPEQLIAILKEAERLEAERIEREILRRQMLAYLAQYGEHFPSADLLLLWLEAWDALNSQNERFREIFWRFVVAWDAWRASHSYIESMKEDPLGQARASGLAGLYVGGLSDDEDSDEWDWPWGPGTVFGAAASARRAKQGGQLGAVAGKTRPMTLWYANWVTRQFGNKAGKLARRLAPGLGWVSAALDLLFIRGDDYRPPPYYVDPETGEYIFLE